MLTADQLVYRTSSYSGNGANCVEVALTSRAARVRDTKNRAAGHFAVDAKRWGAFLTAVKAGVLDL